MSFARFTIYNKSMAQQFQVPQFIEYEARLIGPFTVKQSVTLGFAGIIIFVLWFMIEKFLFFPIAFLVGVAAVFFAFIKINGRPLSDFFTSFLSFFISPQLYIWQKKERKIKEREKFIKKGSPPTDEKNEAAKEITKEEIMQLAKRLNE